MKGDIRDVKICYIGGGSRQWAWVFMKDLCFEKETAGTIRLYDLNMEAARANEALGNRILEENNPGRWKFVAEPSLQKALEGSDFVIISILPGDFEYMAVDVHAPEKYGIYQSVGDTVGPGGLSRALRTVPMYQEIARAIKQWAPDAWVLNYTNPMTICVRTLYREFPGIKAFGCCHEVFNTQKLLCDFVAREGLAEDGEVKREDLTTRVVGINHFTWIDRASWKDFDLFPIYEKYARRFAETGIEGTGDDHWQKSVFRSCERVKFDLFLRFGAIAAAGDRHLAEFCPPSWYMADPAQVEAWKYRLTPVTFRIDQREDLKKKSAAYREGSEPFKPTNSGEEGIRQMKAILGLGDFVTNVNLPNRGQLPGVPDGAVVETNAFFSRDGVSPVVSDGLPNSIRSLVMPHVINQEGIVEAACERDLAKAKLVFMNDVQVRTLKRADSEALFDEMTSKTLDPALGYKRI